MVPPKQPRGKQRKQKEELLESRNSLRNVDSSPQFSRPVTRSQTKQLVTNPPERVAYIDKKQQSKAQTTHSIRKSAEEIAKPPRRRSARQALSRAETQERQSSTAYSEHLQQNFRERQSASIARSSAFLQTLETTQSLGNPSEQSLPPHRPSSEADIESTMAGTDITSRLQSESAVGPQPSETSNKGNPKHIVLQKLWDRRIEDEPSQDDRCEYFRELLTPAPPNLGLDDLRDLGTILERYARKWSRSEHHKIDANGEIEMFSVEVASWMPARGLAVITKKHFSSDVALCKDNNEAILQRTVMLSIIDRWELPNTFLFNCEGQWRQMPEDSRLRTISSPSSSLPQPKPDLAIFFEYSALAGTKFITPPSDLVGSLRPDGSAKRCFPFLFMEAKRDDDALLSAVYTNLYSASHALHNIHLWMKRAGTDKDFYKIRVFTITLNARSLTLRCHRAEIEDKGFGRGMYFYHDEIATFQDYTRDEACVLIKNILIKYAKVELLELLKLTFREAIKNSTLKHKLDTADKTTAQGKKSRQQRQTPSRTPTIQDPNFSFGLSNPMEQLSTSSQLMSSQ